MKQFTDIWQRGLMASVKLMLADEVVSSTIDSAHTKQTPERFVSALKQMLGGCLEEPEAMLNTKFPSAGYSQMIHEKNIIFYSMCAHHLLPFFGTASFAYIPEAHIVGLSKIPKLVHVYARRPQVQEKLTQEIVDTFMDVIQPKGCGLLMRAYHFCMICRGVEEPSVSTETTALKGLFLENPAVKSEFISSAQTNIKTWG